MDYKKIERTLKMVSSLKREAVSCLNNRDYEKAESIAKEIEDLGFLITAADIYRKIGREEKARDLYNTFIKIHGIGDY
ncbi:MAG: hypothetical protein QW286_02760 [Candidatus Aenigmatarchaeota archaeon]